MARTDSRCDAGPAARRYSGGGHSRHQDHPADRRPVRRAATNGRDAGHADRRPAASGRQQNRPRRTGGAKL
jgi:hypothetical protein